MHILILAGGTGTRLWPRSRSDSPKQLLPLIGDRTLVEATVDRVLPIVPANRIFFATNQEYAAMIRDKLPQIPADNMVNEPSPKSTAPCIGLAGVQMQELDPDPVMASLHADHFIADEEGFRQALLAAEELARDGYLVTLGITPTKAETGYGYVQREEQIGTYNDHAVYQVKRFLEKPDQETAEKFFASGDYYWNSGIFIWQISTLMEAFENHLPEFHQKLKQIKEARAAGESIEQIWEQIDPVSIDVGIMEQAEKVAVIPVDIGWNDIGAWDALHEISQADQDGNVVLEGTDCLTLDTSGSLIQGHGRFIAAIGLEDIVIVDTEDALLVCHKDQVQEVKQVVNWLEDQERFDLL